MRGSKSKADHSYHVIGFGLIILIIQFFSPLATKAATQTWDFNDASSNYDHNSSYIEINSGSDGLAKLKDLGSGTYGAVTLSGYTKRKAITVTNNVASVLTNHQVRVDLTFDSDMQSNFGDIRFTSSDGTTEIDYYLESKTDGVSAIFWVEIPSLAASNDTIIYVYYGNGAVSTTSNANNVFDFYDGFDGVSLDTGTWTDSATTSATVNNALSITNGAIYSDSNIVGNPQNKIIETKANFAENNVKDTGLSVTSAQNGAAMWRGTHSIDLNGSDEYVDLGAVFENTAHGDPYTVSVWIKPDTITSNDFVVGSNNPVGLPNIQIVNSKIYFYNERGSRISSVNLTAGQWQHILVTSTNASSYPDVYINGVLRNGGTGGSAATRVPSASWWLGRYFSSVHGTFPYDGKVAGLAVWHSVLNSTDRSAVYNSGTRHDLSKLSNKPAAYWEVGGMVDDDTAGTGEIIDLMGSYHGTVLGTDGNEITTDSPTASSSSTNAFASWSNFSQGNQVAHFAGNTSGSGANIIADIDTGGTVSTSTDYIMGIEFQDTSHIRYYRSSLSYVQQDTDIYAGSFSNSSYIVLGHPLGSNAGNLDVSNTSFDWVRVRKYASTQPTISIGAETGPISYPDLDIFPSAAGSHPQFASLSSFSETLGGSNQGTVRYQLSNNGTNWYYWDGSNWSAASNSLSHSNSAGDVNTNIAKFDDDVGPGDLYFKALLLSNASQRVEIDSLSVEYDALQVSFSSSKQTLNESESVGTITVNSNATYSSDIVVPYTVSGSAQGGGIDHNLDNGSITIAAGQTVGTANFKVTNDTLAESSETLVVTMGSPINAVQGAVMTQTITITDDDFAPVASNASLSVVRGKVKTGTLTAYDKDSGNLTYSLASKGTQGIAVITNTSTGAFRYTPHSDASGTDSFTFKVSDGINISNTATITVSITDPPDSSAPTVTIPKRNFQAKAGLEVYLSANATDPDGDPLSYTWSVIGGEPVTFTSQTDQTDVSFTVPSPGTNGFSDIQVSVTDSNNNPVTTFVRVTILKDSISASDAEKVNSMIVAANNGELITESESSTDQETTRMLSIGKRKILSESTTPLVVLYYNSQKVILGYPSFDNSRGMVALLDFTKQSLPDFIDMDELSSNPIDGIHTSYGEQQGDLFGHKITMTDWNQDRIADLVIASPGAVNGSVSILHGETFEILALLIGSTAEPLKTSLLISADVDGQESEDLIIGIENTDSQNQNLIQKEEASTIDNFLLANTNVSPHALDFSGLFVTSNMETAIDFNGTEPDFNIGAQDSISHVASGNVNGDDYSDLIIASQEFCSIKFVFGSSNFGNGFIDLSESNSIECTESSTFNSIGVSDVTGDEIDDIILGFPEAGEGNGRIYIIPGKTNWDQVEFDMSQGVIIEGSSSQKIGDWLILSDDDSDGTMDIYTNNGELEGSLIFNVKDLALTNTTNGSSEIDNYSIDTHGGLFCSLNTSNKKQSGYWFSFFLLFLCGLFYLKRA